MRFFLIDRITHWQVGVAAEAVKNVTLSEDFFDDHFPRRPVMPGVLMVEGMTQLASLLLEASRKSQARATLTSLERAKFRVRVQPGDTLLYRAEVNEVGPEVGRAAVKALHDGQVVASVTLNFAFQDADDPQRNVYRAEFLRTCCENVPSTFGRGAGGEGNSGGTDEESDALSHKALTLTLSQRERGPEAAR